MNMDKKVLNPYCGICCSIILFDIHWFKPFWEFVLHYFASEVEGVCGASISAQIVAQFGWSPYAVFDLGVVMPGASVPVAVFAHWGTPS